MNKYKQKRESLICIYIHIDICKVLPARLSISPTPEAKTKPVCADCPQTPICKINIQSLNIQQKKVYTQL